MRCMLCGQSIDGAVPSVPTVDGMRVHIVCADRAVGAAHQLRIRQVVVTGVLVVYVLFVAASHLPPVALLVLAAVCCLLHTRLNRHWWCRVCQTARLWTWRVRLASRR
jgi:hypothetical protein